MKLGARAAHTRSDDDDFGVLSPLRFVPDSLSRFLRAVAKPGLGPHTPRMSRQPKRLLVLFGNQLFPIEQIERTKPDAVFMAESESMCRRHRAHRHKILLILSAMRSEADAIRKAGHLLHYTKLADCGSRSFMSLLGEHIDGRGYAELVHFEMDSPRMLAGLDALCRSHSLRRVGVESPMFLTPREEFSRYRATHKRLFMADFYRWQRKRMGVLLDERGKPLGGRWSFDEENRKKLPKQLVPPELQRPEWTRHTQALTETVNTVFPEHPGDATDFWLPTTAAQAEAALETFLEERFRFFGDYEDALSKEHSTVYHSVLSAMLNIGLLTPSHVIERALEHAEAHEIPLNSLEGFVRQIIGWREFIRGIWNALPASHWHQNFWGHDRKLTRHWYDATTAVPPLDDAIRRASATGYNHHIERLMVVGNLMLLCRVDPHAAYRWFMEMYVDSADWVMAPNVYGMALHSEGGSFTSKPYICGSSYLRKMSDYGKGPWCDTVDGLYWSFVDDHQSFFASNPRSKMMLRTLERIDADRKQRIFSAARDFVDRVTQ